MMARLTGPSFFSRLASVRFLSVTRAVRVIEESRTRVLEGPETTDVREVQSPRGASTIAADLDHQAEILDAIAGSEFIDDRIRQRE
jgi:hypothetical protein